MPITEGQSPEETNRLVRRYIDVWNDRAYDSIPDVVAESFVMYDPFARTDKLPGPKGQVHGRNGLETFIRGTVNGFPDFHVDIYDLLCNGHMGLYEGCITMTHEGDFFGIPPTGGHAEFRYVGSLRIAEGAVLEHRVYPPVGVILDQLGLNFPGVFILIPTLALGKIRQLFSSLSSR